MGAKEEKHMESRAKLFGHPIHQMLIVFPLGLLATAVGFDLVSMATGNAHWRDMAFYMIGSGIIMGLIAAVFGLLFFLVIPSHTRAKRIRYLHGIRAVGVGGRGPASSRRR